jgi:predicted alpha/beta-fold hydrolase
VPRPKPVVPAFQPPWWLRHGHLQTVLPVLVPRRWDLSVERERLELEDGDFLDLDWMRAGSDRLVILQHGLEGSSAAVYVRGMAAALQAVGWDALAWNFRGCGEEMNRTLRLYHSGETSDLGRVVRHAATRYARIAVVGFSLGGNVTLKYLGEAPLPPSVVAGAAISVPLDLASCARALDGRFANRLYLHRFLVSLQAKIRAKARQFPDRVDVRGIERLSTIEGYDERYTAPLHGFAGAEDYWARSSARQFLGGIAVPTLVVNARNDPFLTDGVFEAAQVGASAQVEWDFPQHGGHVGFLDGASDRFRWHERRVVAFLERHVPRG